MTEEEIEWYEENWHNGKSLKKRTTNRREYKSVHVSWWVDWDRGPKYYWNDQRCWKTKRKTHYKLPKVKKEKKRKVREKEHWRFKENYSYRSRWCFNRKAWEEKREGQRQERIRQYNHIQELKKTGRWIPNVRYRDCYNHYTRMYHFSKVDLNDPFDHGSYYEHYDRHGKWHKRKGIERENKYLKIS
jgi:hypothetical protein